MDKMRSMNEAPKDRPILAYCIHNEDLLHKPELGIYVAHGEGLAYAQTGFHILEWGGAYTESASLDAPCGNHIPDWWFVARTEFEAVANPIGWWELPEIPKG